MPLLGGERSQVSLEFVLLTGGVILAAVTVYALRGSINAFASVVSDWVGAQRNATLTKITR
ncbi:MAG: class III signal peptide-containing protein [Candidatus Hydrothermarchaeota archaeon]